MAVVNSSRFNLKEGIEAAMCKYLEDYSGEVIEVTEQIVVDIAKESVNRLKKESPKQDANTGHKYSKGWTYELDKGRLSRGATIYGKKGTYNLAHLLEFGHAIKSGGRTTGDAKARVHIKPVEEWAVNEFIYRLERELSWGLK